MAGSPWPLTSALKRLRTGHVEIRTSLVVGNHDAVEADHDLGDVGDTVRGAEIELFRLHAARSVRDVRMLGADAGAEELQAAARTGRLNNRGRETRHLAERFGNGGRERENGGRANDADLVAGSGSAGHADNECGGSDAESELVHGEPLQLSMFDNSQLLRAFSCGTGTPGFTARAER